METGIGIKLETRLGTEKNTYIVRIDGEAFCYTTDDNEGLALSLAINRINVRS